MSKLDEVFQRLASMVKAESTGAKTPEEEKPPPEKDPYTDHDALYVLVNKIRESTAYQRWTFERQWFRNILYYVGNQWITWDRGNRRWREKKLRKWVPKPVTNRFASTTDSIISALESAKPENSFWPASDSNDDIATAEVADDIWPALEEEMNTALAKKILARWVIICANGFLHPFIDFNTSHGQTFVQHERCPVGMEVLKPKEIFEAGNKCPNHPEVTAFEPAVDEMGGPIGETVPHGKMMVDVCGPFEIYLNMEIWDMRKQPYVLRVRAYDIETIRKFWPETGKSVKSDMIEFEKVGQHYFESLAYVTDETAYTAGRGLDKVERATIYELWMKPNEDYPEGLYVAIAGNRTVLEAGPLPYSSRRPDGSKDYFLPFVHFGYNRVPGRFWHKSPATDLIQKQDQRNRIESLIELSIMRGAYSTWILPHGSTISNLTGEPGQVIRWSPTGTQGTSPKLETGQPVPPALFQWIEQIDKDFEDLAGTFDVIKGAVPRGVSAGYAIQLLTERGYSRFGAMFSEWEDSWSEFAKMALSIFQEYATEERVRMMRGDAGRWQIQKFLGASLAGAFDVKVEAGSSKPRSKLAEQATIEQLAKLGVINIQDPEQSYKVAESFGMAHILGGVDEDVRDAAREFDAIQKGVPPRFRPLVDNHIIHSVRHKKDAKSDKFFELTPQLQMVWEQHLMQHEMILAPPVQPAPGNGKGGPELKPQGPETSKAKETTDGTMATLREGGAPAYGAG